VGPDALQVADDATVFHAHYPLRALRDGLAMGDHDQSRPPLPVQPIEQVEHVRGVARVQVARWLVRQHERRLVDQRPRDRHALAFADRQLRR